MAAVSSCALACGSVCTAGVGDGAWNGRGCVLGGNGFILVDRPVAAPDDGVADGVDFTIYLHGSVPSCFSVSYLISQRSMNSLTVLLLHHDL
jgi:hypothetical protein